MSVKRYSVWEDEMFDEKHALNPKNSMVHLMVMHEDYAALEARCAALAAENAGLKDAISCHAAGFTVCEACGEENISGNDDVCRALNETPATDAFLAEVRAQGVDQLASLAGNECQRYKSVNDRSGARKWKSIVILCTDFAAQLRKGVQS